MEKFIINGGKALSGKTYVSGAKNAALAIMPSVLLNTGVNNLTNIPEVNDVFTMSKLLNSLGVKYKFHDHNLTLDSSGVNNQTAPYEHVKKMRASVYVLGPLLSRYGYAKVSLPGGCAWGPRPINLHLEGMKKMGAEIDLEGGYIVAKTKKLVGAKINFDISSVGATGNILMAATLAKGSTIINNAAMEPEITLLADYLNKMGAKIYGINTAVLEIEGVDELKGADVENIPDRIEAGTLLIAAAMTKGKVRLENVNPKHLTAVLMKLEDIGVDIKYDTNSIEVDATKLSEIKCSDVITAIYPGFPTDMQAQWTALMCLGEGISTVTDTIYIDRFKHIPELNRLGASIEILDNRAMIKGIDKFSGAKVMSTDLRASASLVLAGLAAEGTTEVLRIYHLDRGYENIEKKLLDLGADIQRVKSDEF